MTKETIVITGATGKQGGSVVTALLKEGNYHIKALTRDTKSAQAEELVKKELKSSKEILEIENH